MIRSQGHHCRVICLQVETVYPNLQAFYLYLLFFRALSKFRLSNTVNFTVLKDYSCLINSLLT